MAIFNSYVRMFIKDVVGVNVQRIPIVRYLSHLELILPAMKKAKNDIELQY